VNKIKTLLPINANVFVCNVVEGLIHKVEAKGVKLNVTFEKDNYFTSHTYFLKFDLRYIYHLSSQIK
jgi:hypothetical protein